MPESYAVTEGRKVVISSWNPIELLKNPNWITLVVLLVVLLLIAAIVLIIRAAVCRKSSRRYGRRGGNAPSAYRGRRRK